jgi:hypothetical protein
MQHAVLMYPQFKLYCIISVSVSYLYPPYVLLYVVPTARHAYPEMVYDLCDVKEILFVVWTTRYRAWPGALTL